MGDEDTRRQGEATPLLLRGHESPDLDEPREANASTHRFSRAALLLVVLLFSLVAATKRLRATTAADGADVPATAVDGAYPELVVFDLDATFWDQEMFRMTSLPTRTVRGDLNGRGTGVVGVVCRGVEDDDDATDSSVVDREIRLFDGSLEVFQRHYVDGAYPRTRFLFASSADTEFAEDVARAALRLLEVVPGLSVWDAVAGLDWGGHEYSPIGRRASQGLSSDKAATHFPRIRNATGIRYDRMLFFDDCIWGDNVGMVRARCRERDTNLGPAAVRTPNGFTMAKWEEGLDVYRRQLVTDPT